LSVKTYSMPDSCFIRASLVHYSCFWATTARRDVT
jgi:hypothetical protein